MVAYPRLFTPFTSGRLRLKNRIAMLPHGTGMVRQGKILDEDVAYLTARAEEGPGLMITGGMIVDVTSTTRPRVLVEVYDEKTLPGLKARVEALRPHGVHLVGQLLHLGREMISSETEHAPVAPSAIRSPRDPYTPKQLELHEIRHIVDAFGRSAANLKTAGYDGVEIHGAHGYLVHQFLSPLSNARTDAYGGSPEARRRFLLDIVESIRVHCGDDFTLGVRLSAEEELEGGIHVADAAATGAALADFGGVDYLSITLGVKGAYVKDAFWAEAPAARLAKAVKQACPLPIIVGQRIPSPERAEQLLQDGVADIVGLARALIADPDWVSKAAAGESARIRPCVALMQDCRGHSPYVHCAANPVTGRETRPDFAPLQRAETARRIGIVGGGPAGLELARILAERGHRPTLFEATETLGGQFRYAASIPRREGLLSLIDHLSGEVRRQNVDVRLATRVDDLQQLASDFDAVVLATGATPRPPEEEFQRDGVTTCIDLISGGAPPPSGSGLAVVVDDGAGFWWTYGAAEVLVAAGWRIMVVTPKSTAAAGIPDESIAPMLARLARGPAEYRVLTVLEFVGPDHVGLMNATSGESETIACDLVVIQAGRAPVQLSRGGVTGELEVHSIGDCVTPRKISHALYDAQRLGRLM